MLDSHGSIINKPIHLELVEKTHLGMSIIDFFECPWILNQGELLSPIQRIMLKTVMALPLDSTSKIARTHEYQNKEFASEVDMYKHFTGKHEYEPSFYPDVDWCIGRRSGKSTLLGAGLAVYFATQFDYVPYLRTSPHATIPIISPTKEQAGEVYAAIKFLFLKSPYLYETFLDGKIEGFQEEFSEENVKESSLIGGQIKLNNRVVIKVMAADVSKMRGMAVPFAILDECCWFGIEGNDTKNTDKGIYEALAPSLTQFQEVPGMAMILKISSPNGQAGLMYDNYLNRLDPDVIHFQVPTWYANHTVSVNYLEKQKKKGMSFFNREYGAQYTASESSYLDPVLIENCVIKGAEIIAYDPKYRYVAAMDYATKEDYWTLAIGHKEYILEDTPAGRKKKERVQIDLLYHWKGSSGNELDPSRVVPEISIFLKRYRVQFLISDQYAYAPLKTLFGREGQILKEFKVTHQSKLKYMYSMQVAINSDILRMVANPLAVRHLKDLREKRSTTTNTIRIEHAANCHDDYASAIGLVIYQFDKSSPIYVGMSENEVEEVKTTKDGMGKHIAYPMAQELAEFVGISQFFDNRAEVENREKKKNGEGDPEDDGGDPFFFSF